MLWRLQMLDIPTLLAQLFAVGFEFRSVAERAPAYGQAQQVRRAGHRHIHGKQALHDSVTQPSTAVAFVAGKPRQEGIDEVLVVVCFEYQRCGVGLPLAGVNRA